MSSGEWGGLVQDWTHMAGESGGGEAGIEELDGPSRWQEELEYSVYADSSMTVPGRGEKKEYCGVYLPREFCGGCGSISYAQNRCGRRTCPECYRNWERERAKGGVKRLAAARQAGSDGLDKRLVHSFVSVPEGEMRTLEDVYSGFRKAYEMAQSAGVRGGVAIFHPFRVLDGVKKEFKEADYDKGIWRWVMDERGESWRSLTYWSPHYHILGLCRDFEADKPSEQDGWVVRRIDRQNERSAFRPFHLNGENGCYEEMVRTFRYLVSHAGFEPDGNKECIRWFGSLAIANFQAESEVSEGALSTIERKVGEAVGETGGDGEGSAESEAEECEQCGSTAFSSIYEAGTALHDPAWCERLDREQERRLNAAFRWVIGERFPPPGLRYPSTEEEAKEALDEMVM